MNIKRAWGFQSFVICFLLNGIFAGLIFLIADRIMEGLGQWVTPLTRDGGPILPDIARVALENFGVFLSQLHQYMAPALAALTLAATFLLWLFVFLLGRRQIGRAAVLAECHGPETKSSGGNEGNS